MGYKRKPKVINGKEYWQCTRCRSYFLKEGFYKEKRSAIGIKSECKKCHVKTSIESRDKDNHRIKTREWMQKNEYWKRPEVMERERMRAKRRNRSLKQKCRDITNDAIQHRILKKPSLCNNCGKEKRIVAHHDSYYWPLRVKWFCYQCHADLHRMIINNNV